jgi:hypothetical protein
LGRQKREESIMRKRDSSDAGRVGRRAFLKGVMLGGGAAVVTLVAGKAAAQTESEPTTAPAAPAPTGYHVTDHIRDYYRTAGI